MWHISYKCLSSSRTYLAREYNRLSSLLAAQDASRKGSRPLNKNSILMTLINYIVYTINLVVRGFQEHIAWCFSMSIIVRFWVLLQRSGSRTQMLPVKPRAYIPRKMNFFQWINRGFIKSLSIQLNVKRIKLPHTTYHIDQPVLVNGISEKTFVISIFLWTKS